VLLLTSSGTAHAQQKTFTLDPARSQVEFTLGATAHTVHGTFKFTSGAIQFDPATGAASGQLVADTASGQTGNDSRDRKMKHEVLETQKYPEIALTVEHIEGTIAPSGSSTVKVHGAIALHGATHPVDIPVEINISGDQARATAELIVPYVEWGMKNPSTFILRVSKEVTTHITAVGRISSP
jgi:polyisoprenoid-binding protein YceI